MSSTEEINAESPTEPLPAASKLGKMSWRVLALAGFVCSLWLVTFAWQFVDLNSILSRLIKSESDAWLFALTLGPLFVLTMAVASAWPVIIGLPTTLLAFRFALHWVKPKIRFWASIIATLAVFMGVPAVLNRAAQNHEKAFYHQNDVAPPLSVKGRAVVIDEAKPVAPAMIWPPRCDDRCILIFSFGGAKSVTRRFMVDNADTEAKNAQVTYSLRPVTSECQDFSINFPATAGLEKLRKQGLCAMITNDPVSSSQLVIRVNNVQRTLRKTRLSVGRRLVVIDTSKQLEPPITLTRFAMQRYPSLLKVNWKNGGLSFHRSEIAFGIEEALDKQLYRDAFFKR